MFNNINIGIASRSATGLFELCNALIIKHETVSLSAARFESFHTNHTITQCLKTFIRN